MLADQIVRPCELRPYSRHARRHPSRLVHPRLRAGRRRLPRQHGGADRRQVGQVPRHVGAAVTRADRGPGSQTPASEVPVHRVQPAPRDQPEVRRHVEDGSHPD